MTVTETTARHLTPIDPSPAAQKAAADARWDDFKLRAALNMVTDRPNRQDCECRYCNEDEIICEVER